jgi:anti-sigma regulatory factor (Ser/Thr protein kinase)
MTEEALAAATVTPAGTGQLRTDHGAGWLLTARAFYPARPHICTWSYPGRADQIRLVRAALAPLLQGCPVAEDALLICSEMAANAALHSRSAEPGGRFTVCAAIFRGEYVRIEVEDQGGEWVSHRDEERPHGLDLVRALAGDGGWGIKGGTDGRTVWARLDWPPELDWSLEPPVS